MASLKPIIREFHTFVMPCIRQHPRCTKILIRNEALVLRSGGLPGPIDKMGYRSIQGYSVKVYSLMEVLRRMLIRDLECPACRRCVDVYFRRLMDLAIH